MENTQYLKYKDSFKKQCIYTALGGALCIIAAILLIFVPCFKITLEGIVLKEFSVFDEIKLIFKRFSGSDSEFYFMVFGLYQIFALVFIALASGIYVYELVKNISGITTLDNYALEQYDKIKTRGNERERRFFRRFTSSNYFISGIIFEVMYIVMLRYFFKALSSEIISVGSYFALVTGVSWTIMFPIIFFIAAVVMFILRRSAFNKVKMAIIKEDYEIKSNNETSNTQTSDQIDN